MLIYKYPSAPCPPCSARQSHAPYVKTATRVRFHRSSRAGPGAVDCDHQSGYTARTAPQTASWRTYFVFQSRGCRLCNLWSAFYSKSFLHPRCDYGTHLLVVDGRDAHGYYTWCDVGQIQIKAVLSCDASSSRRGPALYSGGAGPWWGLLLCDGAAVASAGCAGSGSSATRCGSSGAAPDSYCGPTDSDA